MDPKKFEKQYMCRLNTRQKEAVFAVDGPVLLLAALGRGEIVAECLDRKLVSFPGGRCELLSVEEMVSRRSKKVEYAMQAERPSAPVINNAALKKDASDHILSQLRAGGFVHHKSFGSGKILSVKDDILTVDFGEKGVRKLGLSASLQNNLLSV